MAAAIDEWSLLTGVRTGEAPGCTLGDLRLLVQETSIKGVGNGYKSLHDAAVLTLMWHTFGRVIDTCFARKTQISMAVSGKLFLRLARIKTSVVQWISIYKAAVPWGQCILRALEKQDSKKPVAKRVRRSSSVAKYINDIIASVTERLSKLCAPLPPKLTPGLRSHSLRRGAVYSNASPKLAIQWTLTRGARLLDSLTKAFAYVGTTTKEDQSVGKVFAGYQDPNLPCITPSIVSLKTHLPDLECAQLLALRGQLFNNLSGFTDVNINDDGAVLDAAMAALFIHLDEFATAVANEQGASGFTSHYVYRFHEALDVTNTTLGARLTLDSYAEIDWHTLHELVVMHEAQPCSSVQPSTCSGDASGSSAPLPPHQDDVVAEVHTLAGYFVNWFPVELWHTATQTKQQFVRADLKACINIMIINGGRDVNIPAAPVERTGVSYLMWKQALWTLAEDLDKKTNARLSSIDRKSTSKTAGSLRKRWRKLRLEHQPEYKALCSAYIFRKSSNGIFDQCTPNTHMWKQKDL